MFNGAIDDWDHHLVQLVAFWSSVMRSTGRYKGSPMAAHMRHKDTITPAMFDRWLSLWGEVTAQLLPADKAAGSGVDLADSATMAKYFTPEMAARIDADARQAAAKDEPPALNGDPFVGAQDWQVSELAIAVAKSTEPDRTMAVIAFKNYGAPTEVKLSLARSAMGAGTGWQIADIDWGYDKLSNILPE